MGSLTLPGGMLYVGRQLPAAVGYGPDPALIDPRLPADFRRPDWAAGSVGYWPSYSDITPGARAAYLTWLAGGRRAPNAPISWPFLFFYGLERRVLVDAAHGEDIRQELPAFAAEVRRLLDLYGENRSFHGYGTRFLQLLNFFTTSTGDVSVPTRTGNPWEVPMALRAGLGELAVDGTPVSADWALAWAHYHPEIYLQTPATRCAPEFEALFRSRYTTQYGPGITIRATTKVLKLRRTSPTGSPMTARQAFRAPLSFPVRPVLPTSSQPWPGRRLPTSRPSSRSDQSGWPVSIG